MSRFTPSSSSAASPESSSPSRAPVLFDQAVHVDIAELPEPDPEPPAAAAAAAAGPGQGHWFEPVAEHLGSAYLRYSFTKGTNQEVRFLLEALGLQPGMRLLDVGCGPGRHSYAFARAGIEVVGIDISERFVTLAQNGAPRGATFQRLDARALPFDAEFDAAISLCQGAFGLAGGPGAPLDGDGDVLAGIGRALRPGAKAAVSAFSAYFQLRYLEDGDSFDANAGVNHERTSVRGEDGAEIPADLWTTCFTPRELRLLAERSGLRARSIWSVSPGAYRPDPPSIDTAEFLLVAERPTPSA